MCSSDLWTGDGLKDIPADRMTPRMLYKESLDEILSELYDFNLVKPCVESKVFGIGVEAYTVGVSGILRFFQLRQGQVRGDDQWFSAAVTTVDDVINLLQRIFRAPLHTKIINDKQRIAAEPVHDFVSPGKGAVQLIHDPGKIRHANRHFPFHQGIGNTACHETFACTNTAPEQQAHILSPHFRPIVHIPLRQMHLWVLPMIVFKCPVLHRPVGKALQLQPPHVLVMQPCPLFFLLLFPVFLSALAFSRMAVTPKQHSSVWEERFLGGIAAASVQQPIFCNVILRFCSGRHKPVHRCLDRFRHKLSSSL